MQYKKINEIPKWAVAPVKKMISAGIIQYTTEFEFPLNDDILRSILIISRTGII